MADYKARQLYDQRNWVELFRYVEPMWMVTILEVLDDLFDRGFIPNPGNYQMEIRQAGVFKERLEVAMAAVLHKHGHSITWGKYWELYRPGISKLPPKQHGEIRAYWFAGPNPGLSGEGSEAAPTVGKLGDWFVTGFGGQTVSIVVGIGGTLFNGNITFTNSNGTQHALSIGVIGPTVGASKGPKVAEGFGKWVAKFPGFDAFAKRFPAFAQFIAPQSQGLSNALFGWLMGPSKIGQFMWNNPLIVKIVGSIPAGSSYGPASLPSPAIGMVAGIGANELKREDFCGRCVLVAVTGTITIAGGGVYGLFFGLPSWPVSDGQLTASSKGMALISAGAVSAQIPALGATASVLIGEIK